MQSVPLWLIFEGLNWRLMFFATDKYVSKWMTQQNSVSTKFQSFHVYWSNQPEWKKPDSKIMIGNWIK